jgi:transposase
MRSSEEVVQRLDAVLGTSRRNAQEILGYAGPTFENFKSAAELAAWAGLCPGNNISAGKAKDRKVRRGNSWLKSVMVAAAWAAARTKSSYFRELDQRKKATRGSQKAIVAVAHSMLVAIYHMVKRGTVYQDLGPDYQKLRNRSQILQKRRNELSRLGHAIEVTDLIGHSEVALSA